ncbi:hypothetical protein CR513_17369, partial [Mucuna pruriens]
MQSTLIKNSQGYPGEYITCVCWIYLSPVKCQIGPNHDEWCEFHHTHGHTTKGCRTLNGQIEKGTITTILGGGMAVERKRYARSMMTVQAGTTWPVPGDPVSSLLNEDYEDMLPHQDDPMVILIVAIEYKIERVLIDQGSSANILY